MRRHRQIAIRRLTVVLVPCIAATLVSCSRSGPRALDRQNPGRSLMAFEPQGLTSSETRSL